MCSAPGGSCTRAPALARLLWSASRGHSSLHKQQLQPAQTSPFCELKSYGDEYPFSGTTRWNADPCAYGGCFTDLGTSEATVGCAAAANHGGAIVSADTGLAPAGTYDCANLPGGWACDDRPWAPYSLNGCVAYTLETDRAFAVDRTGDADLFPSAYYLDPFLQAVDASVVDPLPAAVDLTVVQLLHGCCVRLVGYSFVSDNHYYLTAVYAEDDNGTQLATGLQDSGQFWWPYLCHDPAPSGSNATYNLTLLYTTPTPDGEAVPALAATTWTNRNYRCADAQPSKLALVADPHWPNGTEGTEGTAGQLLQTEIAAGVPVTVTLSADADTAGIQACFGLSGTLQKVSYWDDLYGAGTMDDDDDDDYWALTACDSYVYLRSCDASLCAGRDTDIATACNFTTVAAFEHYLDEPPVTFPHGNAYSCSAMAQDASRGAGPSFSHIPDSEFSYARLVPPPPTAAPTPTPTPTAAPSASGLSPGAITAIAVGSVAAAGGTLAALLLLLRARARPASLDLLL